MTAAASTKPTFRAGRPRTLSRALAFGAAALALAVLVHGWRIAPATVERVYSRGLYPAIDRSVRALTSPLPFAAGDALALALVALLARIWWLSLRKTSWVARARGALDALAWTVGILAVAYVWFMVSWGYNYERVPIEDKLLLHRDRTSQDAVDALANRAAAMLEANVRAAHAEIARTPRADLPAIVGPTWRTTIARLGAGAIPPPVPIKPTIFQPFFAASGTTGFTDPWTHEINLSAGLFAYERPAIYAHEWSHIAGFADESEANYIAAASCIHSRDPLVRYSGWMLVWENLPSNVHVTQRVSQQVVDDIEAIRAREARRQNPVVAHASRAAYNTYLKSNGVKAGYASYGLFIRLLTAGEFDADGLPVLAPEKGP